MKKEYESTLDLVLHCGGGRLALPLADACRITGISEKSWRNADSNPKKCAPFPASAASQGPRRVDARSLAAYLDFMRDPAQYPNPASCCPDTNRRKSSRNVVQTRKINAK